MPIAPIPAVALTPVAYFPKGYFLENLAVRGDGSVLVSSLLHKEIWCVPGPKPGITGIHDGPTTGYIYRASTARQVFMRIAADPDTPNPAGLPEFIAAINKTDDFCIDEGFAYVARHRGKTIDRVPLAPGHGSDVSDRRAPHVAEAHLIRDALPTSPSTVAGARRRPTALIRDAALLRIACVFVAAATLTTGH